MAESQASSAEVLLITLDLIEVVVGASGSDARATRNSAGRGRDGCHPSAEAV
jgi:hypothetical protein